METFVTNEYYSKSEYLEIERLELEKHEYFEGKIYLRGLVSFNRIVIISNFFGDFAKTLRSKNCHIYSSDFRVHIPQNTLFFYPDLSIFNETAICLDSEKDSVLNPIIIIEIFSKIKKNFSHSEKFNLVKQIETLKEYILIDSESIKAIKYLKNDDNSWLMTEMNSLDEYLKLNSVQVELQLVDIYDNVKFV